MSGQSQDQEERRLTTAEENAQISSDTAGEELSPEFMNARHWWWWWIPGLDKKWRLAKRRLDALAEIRLLPPRMESNASNHPAVSPKWICIVGLFRLGRRCHRFARIRGTGSARSNRESPIHRCLVSILCNETPNSRKWLSRLRAFGLLSRTNSPATAQVVKSMKS
jgi:hypothetical protein